MQLIRILPIIMFVGISRNMGVFGVFGANCDRSIKKCVQ